MAAGSEPFSDFITLDNGAVPTMETGRIYGEDSTLDRMMTVAKAKASSPATGDTLIRSGAGVIMGYVVHAVTATNVIEIRDSTAAAGGTVKVTIPAGAAIGVYHFGGVGIECTTGIYLDFTGTGTVSVLYHHG